MGFMQFLDEAKIYLKAGDGGNGCVAFRREKFIPFGGPNGGDGGRGGSIIIQATSALNTLIDYRYKQHFKVKHGEHGKGQERSGKSTENLVLKVPVGTQIYAEDGKVLIADLAHDGDSILVASGGKGGLGNTHFKSSTNRAPRQHTLGSAGEELWVWLKLKLISDVGIIGLPNAGKSSLLSVVSAAKPKIADYPFTTLKPQLGVVRAGSDSFVIADIPGLIAGASKGIGLGDKFLRHIERCKILLHLIDITSPDIYKDYKTIRNELKAYNPALIEKRELIVLNKVDLVSETVMRKSIKKLSSKTGREVLAISTATRASVPDLIYSLNAVVKGSYEAVA